MNESKSKLEENTVDDLLDSFDHHNYKSFEIIYSDPSQINTADYHIKDNMTNIEIFKERKKMTNSLKESTELSKDSVGMTNLF